MLKRIGIILIACAFLSSCQENEKSSSETLAFLSYKTPCYTVSQMLCNVEVVNGKQQVSYTGIDGFNYVWGHAYKISVKVSKVQNPPQDASDTKYELLETISDTEDSVGTRYEYELVELLEMTFIKDEDTLYFLGQPFTCSADVDCDLLLDLNNTGGLVNVVFEYIGNGEIELVYWD